MKFATKDQFRLNLLIYRTIGQSSISCYIFKGHNFDYFEIALKLKYERNRDIWRLMGRITEMHVAVAIVTMVTINILRINKYTLMHGRRMAKLI